jgi:hypothetical protein
MGEGITKGVPERWELGDAIMAGIRRLAFLLRSGGEMRQASD